MSAAAGRPLSGLGLYRTAEVTGTRGCVRNHGPSTAHTAQSTRPRGGRRPVPGADPAAAALSAGEARTCDLPKPCDTVTSCPTPMTPPVSPTSSSSRSSSAVASSESGFLIARTCAWPGSTCGSSAPREPSTARPPVSASWRRATASRSCTTTRSPEPGCTSSPPRSVPHLRGRRFRRVPATRTAPPRQDVHRRLLLPEAAVQRRGKGRMAATGSSTHSRPAGDRRWGGGCRSTCADPGEPVSRRSAGHSERGGRDDRA